MAPQAKLGASGRKTSGTEPLDEGRTLNMLDRFQNLPTAARIAVLIIILALIGGFIALLAKLAPSTDVNPTTSASPSYSVAPTPQATPSSAPSIDISSLGPDERQQNTARPGDPQAKNAKYSSQKLAQAAGVASAALLANCRYTGSQSESQWVDNQRRYWLSSSFSLDEQDYISFIKTQQCNLTNSEARSINSDGTVEIGLAAEQGTVYQEGAPIVSGKKDSSSSYLYYVGGTATMKLQGGKWYVTSLDVQQQGS